MYKLDLEQRSQRSNCQNILDHRKWKEMKKQTNNFCFISLTTLKALTLWITTNCGKFLKRWEYQTTFTVSWETCMQHKKQQLELDTRHWTGSKLGKDYIKAVLCHSAYLIYMQNTSCEMPGWMIHKLESRLLGEIATTSHMHIITTLVGEREEDLKSLLMKVK